MPELPEVETVVRTLRPRVTGRKVLAVELRRADILQPAGTDLTAQLLDKVVQSVERRGKKIVVTLDDGNRFFIHLGMTGQLTVGPPDAPLATHTHLTFDVTAGPTTEQVRFRDYRRFGGVWWLGREASPDERMGPEPLTVRPAQLFRRLAGTRRAIKTALLDQAIVAGLGNIYVDESLFLAGIHPTLPANVLSLAQVRKLNRAIKSTLQRAIRHRGSTLRDYVDGEGAAGGFQSRHRVYARAGKPCRSCKSAIVRIVLGGRSTHYCPACQHR